MKTSAASLVTVLVGASLLVGCASATEPTVAERLVGTWDWVESTGGIAGTTMTPASTGTTMSLRFRSSGVVELSRNGSVVGTTTYTVEPSGELADGTVHYATGILGFESQTVIFTNADALTLVDPCCDGFTYRFVRLAT